MTQHPVDYHYQQFYLQMRQEKEQRRKFHSDLAAGREPAVPGSPRTPRTGRAGRQGDTPRGGGGSPSMSRLDLRSVYADDVDDGAETPRGWLKRTKSLLTPRSSSANRRSPSRRDEGVGWEAVQVTGCHCHHCHHGRLHCHLRLTHLHHLPLQVTAVVRRDPSVGLGMELNAYNQILTVRRAQFDATLAQFCAIILTVRSSSTAAPRHAVLRPSGRPDP